MSITEQDLELPAYVTIDDDSTPPLKRLMLRVPASPVNFPLCAEDQQILKVLEAKNEAVPWKNVTGLSAPQIGYSKRMIVFTAFEDEAVKAMRPDFVQTMGKTIWINPTYIPLSDELTSQYETCLSVTKVAGLVKRFNIIQYMAYTPDGEYVEGEATGFLARLIQHEIDHINGVIFVDKVESGSLISINEYREKYSAQQKQ